MSKAAPGDAGEEDVDLVADLIVDEIAAPLMIEANTAHLDKDAEGLSAAVSMRRHRLEMLARDLGVKRDGFSKDEF